MCFRKNKTNTAPNQYDEELGLLWKKTSRADDLVRECTKDALVAKELAEILGRPVGQYRGNLNAVITCYNEARVEYNKYFMVHKNDFEKCRTWGGAWACDGEGVALSTIRHIKGVR